MTTQAICCLDCGTTIVEGIRPATAGLCDGCKAVRDDDLKEQAEAQENTTTGTNG